LIILTDFDFIFIRVKRNSHAQKSVKNLFILWSQMKQVNT